MIRACQLFNPTDFATDLSRSYGLLADVAGPVLTPLLHVLLRLR
jgi:hypothetical protein